MSAPSERLNGFLTRQCIEQRLWSQIQKKGPRRFRGAVLRMNCCWCEIDARVVSVSAIVATYFSEQVAQLQAIADSPTVRSGDSKAMSAYFRRVQPPKGK